MDAYTAVSESGDGGCECGVARGRCMPDFRNTDRSVAVSNERSDME